MASCSICHNALAKPHGRCKKCHASYMRENRRTKKGMHARKAFRAGAQSMQQSIVAQLRTLGSNDLNGFAAANLAERLEIPHVSND